MGLVHLTDWTERGSMYVLDRERNVIAGPKQGVRARSHGYAAKVDGDMYSLYGVGWSLFFRANDLEWECSNIALRYRRFFMFEWLSVRRGGTLEYSRWYLSFVRWRESLRDPTFDVIDSNDLYFLHWCSYMLSDADRKAGLLVRLRAPED